MEVSNCNVQSFIFSQDRINILLDFPTTKYDTTDGTSIMFITKFSNPSRILVALFMKDKCECAFARATVSALGDH